MEFNLFTKGQYLEIKQGMLRLDTNKVKIEDNQNCDFFNVKAIWILICALSEEYGNEIGGLYKNNPAQLCSTLSTFLQNSAFEDDFTKYQRSLIATVLNMSNEGDDLFIQYAM